MKRITVILVLTTLAALVASPLVAAGIPGTINLQGRFTDAAGNNVADGVYSVVFRIYDDSIAGSALWSDTLPVQVTDGLFTVLVGNSTAIPADLFSGGTNRYLGVTVNLEPEMPRIPLGSGAYVYQAQDADVATLAQDLTCIGCVSAGEVAANAIGSAEIIDNSIVAADIGPNAVGASEIATAAVVGGLGGDIADGTITEDDLGTKSVGAEEISGDAVGAEEIAADAVGSSEIATDAVGPLEIVAGSVGASEIATDAVGADEIDANAVGSAEIIANAVGAAEINADAVGAIEIAAGAVGTSEVANGSLTAVDIDDEPGVASNNQDGFTIMDGTTQTLLSRTIIAPAAGYVLAIATAELQVRHTFNTPSRAEFGVSEIAGSFPASQNVRVEEAIAAPSGDYYQAVTVHGLFSTLGGSESFFFLGDELAGDCNVRNLQFTLIYFPTAHGLVVPTVAASGGEELSSQSIETGLVLPEFVGEPVQSQVESPAGFQPDLAQVIVQMEARIQKLEEQLSLSQPEAEEKK